MTSGRYLEATQSVLQKYGACGSTTRPSSSPVATHERAAMSTPAPPDANALKSLLADFVRDASTITVHDEPLLPGLRELLGAGTVVYVAHARFHRRGRAHRRVQKVGLSACPGTVHGACAPRAARRRARRPARRQRATHPAHRRRHREAGGRVQQRARRARDRRCIGAASSPSASRVTRKVTSASPRLRFQRALTQADFERTGTRIHRDPVRLRSRGRAAGRGSSRRTGFACRCTSAAGPVPLQRSSAGCSLRIGASLAA